MTCRCTMPLTALLLLTVSLWCGIMPTTIAAEINYDDSAVCNVSQIKLLKLNASETETSTQCSGHGECIDPGECECDVGYDGATCQLCGEDYVAVCYEASNVPGETLCGGALSHEIEEKSFATLFFCFGMVLLLGILIEFFIHCLKHCVHHEKWAKKILESLIAELVTLGLISFVLFLISNACGSDTLHTDYFDLEVFEYLHMLLFITVSIFLATVMFLIGGGLCILRCYQRVMSEAVLVVRKRRKHRIQVTENTDKNPAILPPTHRREEMKDEDAPIAPPRRSRTSKLKRKDKSDKHNKPTTVGYVTKERKTEHSSLLDARKTDISSRINDHKRATDYANLTDKLKESTNSWNEDSDTDGGEPPAVVPAATIRDFLPHCGCERPKNDGFHTKRLAEFLHHLLDELDLEDAQSALDSTDDDKRFDFIQYLKNCFLQDCERVVTLGWQLYLLTIILVPIISWGPVFEICARIIVLAIHLILFWKGCDMQRRLYHLLRRQRWKATNSHNQYRVGSVPDDSWITVDNRAGARMTLRRRIDLKMLSRRLRKRPKHVPAGLMKGFDACRKRLLSSWCGSKVPDSIPRVKSLFWAGRPEMLHTFIQVCLLMDGILWSYNATVEENSSPPLAICDGILGIFCLLCVVSVILSHSITTAVGVIRNDALLSTPSARAAAAAVEAERQEADRSSHSSH